MQIASRWFSKTSFDDGITHLTEPHVDPLLRCNIWHVRGGDRDLLIDSGLGLCSLREAEQELFGRETLAVASHTHYDHIGGLHEFEHRAVHPSEAANLIDPEGGPLTRSGFGEEGVAMLREVGYDLPNEDLLTAHPHQNFSATGAVIQGTSATLLIDEGDVIDIGQRRFEVMHLPGHSPGSIGLWEDATQILFSGDAIYDGPLLDFLPESDVEAYIRTMKRLYELPVRVVHAGHEASFGVDKLKEIVQGFLRRHES